MSDRLSDVQDVDVNYYVLVPFTTLDGAAWATGYIPFDTHIIGRAGVDQNTAVYETTTEKPVQPPRTEESA